MAWIDVERNAQNQKEMFARQSEGRAQIETYYPELHTGQPSGDFVNTSGGPIIADLITAPHVIVDLYPFENESEMIEALGVDGAFLRSLRDRGLITVAVNADLARFKNLEWLFDILADNIRLPRACRSRWPDELRGRSARELSARGRLCGQDFERNQARRFAGGASDQVRAGGQPEDCEGARAHDPGIVSAARRRGD